MEVPTSATAPSRWIPPANTLPQCPHAKPDTAAWQHGQKQPRHFRRKSMFGTLKAGTEVDLEPGSAVGQTRWGPEK
eukprot:1161696-Pelagomonas_calceolata.AAC.27